MKEVRQLPLDEVAEGAELAADVLDGEGRKLLDQGARLTPEMLASLARRGVRAVAVFVENDITNAEAAARREEIAARIAHLFRGLPEDGPAGELRRAVLAYRQEVLR